MSGSGSGKYGFLSPDENGNMGVSSDSSRRSPYRGSNGSRIINLEDKFVLFSKITNLNLKKLSDRITTLENKTKKSESRNSESPKTKRMSPSKNSSTKKGSITKKAKTSPKSRRTYRTTKSANNKHLKKVKSKLIVALAQNNPMSQLKGTTKKNVGEPRTGEVKRTQTLADMMKTSKIFKQYVNVNRSSN